MTQVRAQLTFGDSYSVTINYTNTDITTTGVNIVDTLPADWSFNSCSGAPCSDNGGEVVWNLGTVTSGASETVTLVFTVSSCAVTSGVDNSSIDVGSPQTVLNLSPLAYTVNCSTSTPTDTPTNSPTPLETFTPSSTPTLTNTFTATNTGTTTPTFTFSATPTLSPTATATFTTTYTGTATSTFTPSSTATVTPTATSTFTTTNTDTVTSTFTPSSTPTQTCTMTPTATVTNTATLTFTNTPCGFPGNTCTWTPTFTPTNTPYNADIFTVTQNILQSSGPPVSIYVNYTDFPGYYSLRIYNSAGEHIKTLDDQQLSKPVDQWYSWNGKNKYGDPCASGVYIIYLIEPFSVKTKKILLVH